MRNKVHIQQPVYSFDRFTILFRCHVGRLRKTIPQSKLKPFCRELHIRVSSKKAQEAGFPSCIEVFGPEQSLFDKLNGYLWLLPRPYFISYVEVTKDIHCRDKEKSVVMVESILGSVSRKYNTTHLLYDARELDPFYDESKFGTHDKYHYRSGYFGRDGNKLHVYARISPVSKQPSCRMEWRIGRTSRVKKRTGIKTLLDMESFDFEKFFTKQEALLRTETINYARLGQLLMHYPRFDTGPLFGEERSDTDGLLGRLFCLTKAIEHRSEGKVFEATPACLRQYLRQLKMKARRKVGRLSEFEEMVLGWSSYTLNSLFCKAPDQEQTDRPL